MRTTYRRIDPGLIDQLEEAPQRFEFFQAVRLLDRWFRRTSNHIGDDTVSEQIRFRNPLSLHFAPSQIEALQTIKRLDAEGHETGAMDKAVLTPSFIGLLGLHGGLPIHYTERVSNRQRQHRDDSTRAFFDLFSNRAVGHFYRAWKKNKLAIQYENDRKNRFLPLVLSLAGLGFDPLRNRLRETPGAIDDESIAYFAGLLRQRPLSATTLQSMLRSYFRVPVQVEQFIGKWYAIPSSQRSTIGQCNAVLGQTLLLGERVWQRNLRVRIRIGPLPLGRYLGFLPNGELAAVLEKFFTLATGYQFEYEIRPVLRAADVRPTRLTGETGTRLGFDSFLVTRPAETDRSDTVYELHPIH
jgi:type VI secretion system protein ImpH